MSERMTRYNDFTYVHTECKTCGKVLNDHDFECMAVGYGEDAQCNECFNMPDDELLVECIRNQFNTLGFSTLWERCEALQLIRLAEKHGFKELREEMYRAYVSGG